MYRIINIIINHLINTILLILFINITKNNDYKSY